MEQVTPADRLRLGTAATGRNPQNVDKTEDMVRVGETVKVIGIDTARRRISLSPNRSMHARLGH